MIFAVLEKGVMILMPEELKPCPFCGEKDFLEETELDGGRTTCVWCNHCGSQGPYADNEKIAKKLWNKRV